MNPLEVYTQGLDDGLAVAREITAYIEGQPFHRAANRIAEVREMAIQNFENQLIKEQGEQKGGE